MKPAEFYRSLPKKRMGSGCLICNEAGELLLVKPNYKAGWEIPGGVVEDGESPRACCIREVQEELGLTVTAQQLLLVDYNTYPDAPDKTEALMFIFDGGQTSAEQITLDMGDHETCAFVPVERLQEHLPPALYRRTMLAIRQKANGGAALYSEDQES